MTASKQTAAAADIAIFPAVASYRRGAFQSELFERFPALELASRRAVAPPGELLWGGPEVLGAKIVPLWTPEELIFVFEVCQPDACNRAAAGKLWSQDCLEFYLDCRERRDDNYTGNAWHLVLAPPAPGPESQARLEIADGRPLPPGTRFEITRTGTGWRGELALAAAGVGKTAFRPGDRLHWGVQLLDTAHFRKTRNPFTPITCLRFPLLEAMFCHALSQPGWVLAEGDPAAVGGLRLDHALNVEIPPMHPCARLTASMRPTPVIARRTRFWRLAVTDADGRRHEDAGELFTIAADWSHCAPGRAEWVLTLLDAEKREIGFASGAAMLYDAIRVKKLCSAAMKQVQETCRDLDDPMKVSQSLLAAAGVERVRRVIFLKRPDLLEDALNELEARLGTPGNHRDPRFRLLALTTAPDRQTTVEFPCCHPLRRWNGQALVKVHYGALPLAWAQCTLAAGPAPECDRQEEVTVDAPRRAFPGEPAALPEGKRQMVRLELASGLCCDVFSPAPEAARLLAQAIRANRPLTAAEHRAMRLAVADELKKRLPAEGPTLNLEHFQAGDIHCHTMFSDGTATPLEMLLHALHTYMDFVLISDHESAAGALQLKAALAGSHAADFLVVGQETGLPEGHFNSYPLTESLPPGAPLAELIELAHRQGAIVQWNHPESYTNRFDWQKNGIPAGVALSAWEHPLPLAARNWAKKPPLTGGSDSHNTAFPQERTVAVWDREAGETLCDAILSHRSAVYAPDNAVLFDHEPTVGRTLLAALTDADGTYLAAHRKRLARHLDCAWCEVQRRVFPVSDLELPEDCRNPGEIIPYDPAN